MEGECNLKRATRAPRPGDYAYCVSEVAKRLGVSASHVSNLIEEGKIFAFNIAGPGTTRKMWRIPVEALEQFKFKQSNFGDEA
jgi:excisionase family DNA binding protein